MNDEAMVLYVLPREGPSRAGFVSGRRVGGAVLRNRARRLMKEAWRALGAGIPAGHDLVFVARPSIRRVDGPGLLIAMAKVMARAGVLAPGRVAQA